MHKISINYLVCHFQPKALYIFIQMNMPVVSIISLYEDHVIEVFFVKQFFSMSDGKIWF